MSDLKRLIRRRKLADKAFAVVGFLSVVVGLATLSALLYSLWRDAKPRLFVPEGTVRITEGEARSPDGRALYPDEQAWEIQKISGAALRTVTRDNLTNLLAYGEFFDIPRLRQLAQGGKLKDLVEDDRLGELVRTDHLKQLVAQDRLGELVSLSIIMPAARVEELRRAGESGKLLDAARIKSLVDEGKLATLFNKRKLADAVDDEYGAPGGDARRWAQQPGELERRLPSLLRRERLAELFNFDQVQALLDREYALAEQRPKELNTSFFFTLKPSAYPETTGILVAWVDSLLIIGVTMLAALPVGVGAGLYLEEYARKNRLTTLIEINIANLAGVPSIIYGLMALGFFIYQIHMGRSIATAGLTLALLVLPIVIIATREAIRAIPQNIREASYGCGATKWQTVRHHILPYSMGGILTGSIIGLSRAIGETAPLITIGALTFVTTLPGSPVQGEFPFFNFEWLRSGFTAMPLLMYNLISKPQAVFHQSAALAGIVLIVMTLSLNGLAIWLRYRLRRSIKW